jgi:hypothetical protein
MVKPTHAVGFLFMDQVSIKVGEPSKVKGDNRFRCVTIIKPFFDGQIIFGKGGLET